MAVTHKVTVYPKELAVLDRGVIYDPRLRAGAARCRRRLPRRASSRTLSTNISLSLAATTERLDQIYVGLLLWHAESRRQTENAGLIEDT